MNGAIRPGLAKTRGLPLVLTRQMILVRASDPCWRDLFDRADTVSEGSVRDEAHGRVWYGSTSMILPTMVSDNTLLAALAARDVHVRVRALRTAHREACCRAPSRLGRLACEVQVSADVRGVRIDVDLQAPLIDKKFAPRAAR
ncbi:MAG: hypothetical protein M3O36_09200 [Myxococcota bacterium]|nr:hypothetical protein [Myxococcota bacterium]